MMMNVKEYKKDKNCQSQNPHSLPEKPNRISSWGKNRIKLTQKSLLKSKKDILNKCDICDETFEKPSQVRRHKAKTHKEMIANDFQVIDLNQHLNNSQNEIPQNQIQSTKFAIQCQFCELGFSKQDILDRHIRVMHEAAVLSKFHNFDSFSEAIQRNKIQSDLVHHINTGSDNMATNIMEDYSKSVILVPKQYKSESAIEKPAKSQSKIKIHSEGFAYCQFCEMKFEVDENSRKSKMIFLRHQEQCKQTAHINLNLKSGKKSCPKCFKEFPPILFKAHVKSQHYLCEICMKWFSSLKSQKEHTATCKFEPEKIVEHQSEAIRRSFESSVNKISEGLAYCEFCEMSYEVNENYTISKHLKTLTHMNNVEKKNNSWSNSITSSRTKTEKIVEPNNFELGQQSEEILSDPLADDSMEISDPENISTANHQSPSMLEVKDELLDTSETIYVKTEPLY